MKSKKNKSYSSKQMLSNTCFVLRFLFKTNKKIYLTRIAAQTIQIIAAFVPIIFTRLILNALTENNTFKDVIFYIIVFALTTFVLGLLGNIIGYCDQNQMAKTRYLANLELGRSVVNINYSDLEKPETKTFVALAQEDSIMYILTLVSNLITALIKVIGLSAIVLTFQPLILLLIAVVIAVKMIIDRKKRARLDFYRTTWAPVRRESDYMFEIMRELPYAKEIRINEMPDWVCGKLDKHLKEKAMPLYKKQQHENNRLEIFTKITGIAQECVVYIILAYRVIFSGMLIGDFSMYMTSINSFSESVSAVFWDYSRLIIMGRFAKEFRQCLDLEKNVKRQLNNNNANTKNWTNIRVEFKNVSFTYPNTDKEILNNISFCIEPGESLSIVGINGAGKTTLIKLLCRLYEPTSGNIIINNTPIEDIPLEEYYDLLSVVFQDFKLFAFSVKDNITLDSEDFSLNRLFDSVEKSGLAEKIASLPKGIDTMISKEFDDYGIEFSGGEGQKLAIARALYKNAPMIILDEPTSALDPIAEYEIYNRFHQLTKGKSTIYISHRLSSSKFTDKIAVFSEGKLIEYGHHSELYNIKDGVYRKMFDMQAQYYR